MIDEPTTTETVKERLINKQQQKSYINILIIKHFRLQGLSFFFLPFLPLSSLSSCSFRRIVVKWFFVCHLLVFVILSHLSCISWCRNVFGEMIEREIEIGKVEQVMDVEQVHV